MTGDPQTGVQNRKAREKYNTFLAAEDEGLITSEYRRPNLYAGERDDNFKGLNGAPNAEVKRVRQNKAKMYEALAQNITKSLANVLQNLNTLDVKMLPDYLIEILLVPTALKMQIMSDMQSELGPLKDKLLFVL